MDSHGKDYWEHRWKSEQTGWDIGYASTPLVKFFDTLENKQLKILIPGCGNAYEAEYLTNNGFDNVWVVDISPSAIDRFLNRVPQFPKERALCINFFDLNQKFDLIIEQTFFCALMPHLRNDYAKKCNEILNDSGRLVGLLFNTQFEHEGPPHGGTKAEYESIFKQYFNIHKMEPARNSIEPRQGKEFWINLMKKPIQK